MATATAEKRAATDTAELLLILATDGEKTLDELAGKVPDAALAVAWARGEIEVGRTKYVATGNPATAIDAHNGVKLPPPCLIVEGGLEWSGPKQRWHAPWDRVKAEALPRYGKYQKYQLEVCVNRDKDVWEWLPEGQDPDGRETRYARRDVNRAEAERLFRLAVRLTDRGAAALAD